MKRDSKILTSFLLVLLAGVWGAVGYQIYSAASITESDDTQEFAFHTKSLDGNQGRFVYAADARDPFLFKARVVETLKKIDKPKVAPPAWVPPPFRLTGILVNAKRKTALLEEAGGATYFLKEGDSLRGVKIVTIGRDQVVYNYLGQKREWRVGE